MNTSQIYIVVSIAVLAIIALLFLFARKSTGGKRLTPLTNLAFLFILAGFFFGEHRLVGYGLFGVGVLLAIIDIYYRSKFKKT